MTNTSATATAPFRFFDAQVVRSACLGPSMVRITLGGESLRDFAGGGRDQSFSLFLPHTWQTAPVVPTGLGDGWFTRWRAMDPAVRAVMRSYTVRELCRERAELKVDFALRGAGTSAAAAASGPASRWARRAGPGDRVILLGPAVEDNRSVSFRPPEPFGERHGSDWVLIAADETALPAAANILAWLPAGARAKAWIEVRHAGDIEDLQCRADAEVTWLVRGDADGWSSSRSGSHPVSRSGTGLVDAVRDTALPDGAPYAWIAGESGTVRALRRHLVGERGFDREQVVSCGYWRLGASEEDLRAEALSSTSGDSRVPPVAPRP
ncbi:siderophore-interacting protein [Wenjunlia tyrosinilytica]|uniref:Siderophore-interacting protein n=1 Tax=Wenjunlia tyrosinilytica TaxID=1544741 RepID=A0A918E1I3_9ACTN|nr:siderophore-interacting protein [Wenjunlia tyrosinilytica]GGO97812.1 siderophore-interacting protein [Wenjunlia tyrosinilytica]